MRKLDTQVALKFSRKSVRKAHIPVQKTLYTCQKKSLQVKSRAAPILYIQDCSALVKALLDCQTNCVKIHFIESVKCISNLT